MSVLRSLQGDAVPTYIIITHEPVVHVLCPILLAKDGHGGLGMIPQVGGHVSELSCSAISLHYEVAPIAFAECPAHSFLHGSGYHIAGQLSLLGTLLLYVDSHLNVRRRGRLRRLCSQHGGAEPQEKGCCQEIVSVHILLSAVRCSQAAAENVLFSAVVRVLLSARHSPRHLLGEGNVSHHCLLFNSSLSAYRHIPARSHRDRAWMNHFRRSNHHSDLRSIQ